MHTWANGGGGGKVEGGLKANPQLGLQKQLKHKFSHVEISENVLTCNKIWLLYT